MRHHKSRRRLSRFGSSRTAMLKSMAVSILRYERITTTLPRAKEIRRFIDKLINLGKKQDLSSRRSASALLGHRETVELLFKDIALRFKDSTSGYTRIMHVANRKGDNASMAIIELTIIKPKEKRSVASKKKKKTAGEAQTKTEAKESKPKEERIVEAEIIKEKKEKAAVDSRREREEKPAEPGKKEAAPRKKEKTKGFMDGLRGMFKRTKKDNKD